MQDFRNRDAIARRTLLAATGGAALLGLPRPGAAQDSWPSRPVRIMVGFGAGGVTDVAVRLLAEGLRPMLSQPIVIENRSGASGMVAAGMVARAEPDGHTLIAIPGTITIVPSVMKSVQMDVLKDLAPITLFATSPNVMVVNTAFPARTLQDFVTYAKSRPPEDIVYASSGVGTTVHFMAGMVERTIGVRMRHVPYRSSAESIRAAIAGEVPMVFSSVNSALPHIQSGAVRALAVASERRTDFLPDVLTFAEAGYPAIRSDTWFGLAGPAGLPQSIITRLAEMSNRVIADPSVRQRLAALGAQPVGLGPRDFAALMQREVREFGELASAMGIRAE
jgi:tripartite-type tricarboxylate transporter receptor subunit TctC